MRVFLYMHRSFDSLKFLSRVICALIFLISSFYVDLVEGALLIQGGKVVNHDQEFLADILVENGKIKEVGLNLKVPRDTVIIDASNKYVMPGGIDPHTHLDMPFMGQVACDDFTSGQSAALAGGTTMHVDFALPVDGDLMRGFQVWRDKAVGSVMDYAFHMAVTSWDAKVEADMEALASLGINSFKFFLAYKGALMVTDPQFLSALQKCKQIGALAQVHAENGDAVALGQELMVARGILGPEGHALSRPPILEGEATGRAIRLAAFVNTPLYVVHVMSKDALKEVQAARAQGLRVIGETVTSALTQDESKMWNPDFKTAAQFVMSPPIRSKEHQAPLRQALTSGDLALVATDHAVFNSTQKAVGRPPKGDFRILPNGVNGIEERMHMVWETLVHKGQMTRSRFVDATSTQAAKIFNIYPQKGLIAPGSDADIIIFDPAEIHTISASTHHSRMDTNIYEGLKVHGKVVVTISQGQVVWQNGILNVKPGAGRFIEMKPFGPIFEGIEKQDATFLSTPYGNVPVSRNGSDGNRDEL